MDCRSRPRGSANFYLESLEQVHGFNPSRDSLRTVLVRTPWRLRLDGGAVQPRVAADGACAPPLNAGSLRGQAMSYTIQAFIGDEVVLGPVIGELPSVRRSQGKLLVLLTEEVRSRYGIPSLPLTDEGEEPILPQSIADLCFRLSARGRIAYLEAEIFGGTGLQATVLAEGGVVSRGPIVQRDAINLALRAILGVSAAGCIDEFQALDLGGSRHTDEWLLVAEPKGRPALQSKGAPVALWVPLAPAAERQYRWRIR